MMPLMSYRLDPEADLELILHKPNTQVLLPALASIRLNAAATNQMLRTFIKPSQQPLPNPFQTPSTATGANDMPVSFTRELTQHSNPTIGRPEDPQQADVRFQVSSNHLRLASPVFRAMLNGPWSEGTPSDGSCRSISTTDWDQGALLILFNIIHGHHGEVPRSLDLETLCKFATIVDYYECHEIVDIFADRWLNAMERSLPTTYGPQSTLFLCVTWVFKRPKQFESMTELALRHGEGPIETTNLPIADILGQ